LSAVLIRIKHGKKVPRNAEIARMQFVPETAYCTFGHARQGNGGAKRTTIAGRCSVPAMSGCGGKPISADAVFSENLLLVA
jgi:hypothetical protein